MAYGKEEHGITSKARTLPNKRSNKKGNAKKPASSKKDSTKYDETVPEEQKPNSVAKVHVDRDLRWPKTIREQLLLEPGDKWKFSIVSASKTEFTIKATKVEG